jgi:hypothetical protein
MKTFGMLGLLSRKRAAHLFLGASFLWSLLLLQTANGSYDLSRFEQREYFAQGQASSLPIVADQRGKLSPDRQINCFARSPQEEFEAFEHTLTADRATVVRAITPPPTHVVHAQHMSSEL